MKRTHNVPHTAPLGIVIEDVALGCTVVGGAGQGTGRGRLVIPLDPPLHHLLLNPLHLRHTKTGEHITLSGHPTIPHST